MTTTFSKSSVDTLFEKNKDHFLTLLFLISLVGCLIEFISKNSIDTAVVNSLEFISKMVFLNHIHVFFTPLMLWSSKTGRTWCKEQQEKNYFIAKSILFFLFSIVFSYIAYSHSNEKIARFLNIFVLTWGTFHIMRQSWGLSLLYRSQSNENVLRFKKFYLFIFNVLILLQIVVSCIPRYRPAEFIYSKLILLSYLVATFYILGPLLFSKKFLTRSSIFDFRILVYPLALVSDFGRFGMLSIHGVEYFYITSRFLVAESTKRQLFIDSLYILIFLIVLFSSFNLLRMNLTENFVTLWIQSLSLPINNLIAFLKATSITFTLYHFWVDGFMYRGLLRSNSFI